MEPNVSRDDEGLSGPLAGPLAQPAAPARGRSLRQFVSWRYLFGLGMLLFTLSLIPTVPTMVASRLTGRAEMRYNVGDIDGAFRDLAESVTWDENLPDTYIVRSRLCRAEHREPELAWQDVTKLWKIHAQGQSQQVWSARAVVAQWLAARTKDQAQAREYHRLAVQDFENLWKLDPRDALPWNNLAYARALAGTDLELGLREVNQSLEMIVNQKLDYLKNLGGDAPPKIAEDSGLRNYQEAEATILDTRGFLLHLLKQDEDALQDLDRAIQLYDECVAAKRKLLPTALEKVPAPLVAGERTLREWQQTRAVLLHHRGLAHQALGHATEADRDLKSARDLGFAPANGVF